MQMSCDRYLISRSLSCILQWCYLPPPWAPPRVTLHEEGLQTLSPDLTLSVVHLWIHLSMLGYLLYGNPLDWNRQSIGILWPWMHQSLKRINRVRSFRTLWFLEFKFSSNALSSIVKSVFRDLPRGTTCFEGPHTPSGRSHISMQLNMSPKTTCLERPYFYAQWDGLSGQVLLYMYSLV